MTFPIPCYCVVFFSATSIFEGKWAAFDFTCLLSLFNNRWLCVDVQHDCFYALDVCNLIDMTMFYVLWWSKMTQRWMILWFIVFMMYVCMCILRSGQCSFINRSRDQISALARMWQSIKCISFSANQCTCCVLYLVVIMITYYNDMSQSSGRTYTILLNIW